MSVAAYFNADENGHKSFELPGASPHYNPDRPGQVEHIALDLDFDIPKKSYSGTCTITLNPVRNGVDSLTLDAVSLTITSVTIGDEPQPFDYDGEQLHIHLTKPTLAGQAIALTIAYAVKEPQRGIYFIAPDEHYPDKPHQVWTQGEDEDSRFWFPCFDYPGQLATSEVRVRVPKKYFALSNGDLISTEDDGKAKIYHWKLDKVHPSYLMTLAIGEYDSIETEWRGRPVRYYVAKGRKDQIQLTMGKTPQMMERFSQVFGYDYPFSNYDQACPADFIFGGMENTTTTLLTDRCLLDKRAAIDNLRSETLVAHELAHQWFGDLIVINHWSHAWVKEGMATYSEVLWLEEAYGRDEAMYYHLNHARDYLAEDASRYRRPLVTHIYREPIELYDRHIYEKGSCVYHMIRQALGDELFTKTLQTLLTDNAHSTVETVDVLRAIDKATGKNLRYLFDQYVYRGGHPDYSVTYSWDSDSNLAKLMVTQTQVADGKSQVQEGLFDLKIPIGFGYGTGKTVDVQTVTVRIHERQQAFYFPLQKKPDFISFDVGNHTLKTIQLEYPLKELQAQLQHDPDPISRLYAAKAIAKKGTLEAVKTLSAALVNDAFWAVRAEVAEALATIQLDQAVTGLLKGLEDKHPKVRRAVVNALAGVKTVESYKALKSVVEKGDKSYYVESAAAMALGKVGASTLDNGKNKEKKTLKLLEMVLEKRAGWNEVVRSGAIGGLSVFKSSEAALDLLLPYTEIGVPQALRLTAIRALGRIAAGQSKGGCDRILDRLEAIAREEFFLTQVAVVMALGQMEVSGAVRVLRGLAEQSPDGRVKRRAEEAMGKVRKAIGADKAVDELRRDLDELKQLNRDLKSRLETLEAKAKAEKKAND
ncbi:M1 family metallopeptidase [Leptolyngbya cf. ectocarpi LEGE 11479]|uniref:Aminopeptidase N n=1 Tax=Leptolyngbya cf. ectocarpi LEGE 11479 TaxID=1828722 RepID=A0A928WYZ9_LEPEC|nr:M1 family metallopeptidase [Leptolyngbya ectocarpi]MBE9065902.1 M1 family metallopeptidase [Leptolyngbya cf. ectocarpi LEGE 11479]